LCEKAHKCGYLGQGFLADDIQYLNNEKIKIKDQDHCQFIAANVITVAAERATSLPGRAGRPTSPL
jgi:hypothetical protein